MVTILPKHDPFGGLIKGLGDVSDVFGNYMQQRKENEALQKRGIDLSDIRNPAIRQKFLNNELEKRGAQAEATRKEEQLDTFLSQIPEDQLSQRDRSLLKASLLGGSTSGAINQLLKPPPQPKSEIPLTPYQEKLVKQREEQLNIQKSRIDLAKQKGSKDLPQKISTYTKSYAKDLGLQPDEKLELDKLVNTAYTAGDMPLDDALSSGIEQLAQRREGLEMLTQQLPSRPFGADFRGEAKNQAMQQTGLALKQAFDAGIPLKQLSEAIKGKGWKKDEIKQIMDFVEGGAETQQQAPQAAQARPQLEKFNPKNPKHVARAKQLLTQTDGDKAKANALLSQEFTK